MGYDSNRTYTQEELQCAGYKGLENPVVCFAEEWKDITEDMIPNICPYYIISNYGRLFSKQYGYCLMLKDSNGYLQSRLILKDGTNLYTNVHRLVALAFVPGRTQERDVVDHINCIRWWNLASNLRWVTTQENCQFVFENNPDLFWGESHPTAIYSDVEVHEFCKYMQDGLKSKDIFEIKGITDKKEKMALSTYLYDLKNQVIRKDITCQYNFNLIRRNIFTDEDVHQICKYILDGYNNTQIYFMMNVDPCYHRYKAVDGIQKIRIKINYKNISDLYF